MVSVKRSQSQGAIAPCVRIGVGGRWTVEELQRSLTTFLASTGWRVMTRSAEGVIEPAVVADCVGSTDTVPLAGLVELVPLGDGLSQVVGFPESEELDAVVISPLAESGAEGNAMTARRYLARFVRQLRPGGATIFAADDPVSDIFSAIRLDCQRLGYTGEGDSVVARTPGEPSARSGSGALEADPDDRSRLVMAAMTVVQAFGLGVQEPAGTIGALIS